MNDLVSRMIGGVTEDVPVPCAAVTTKSMRSRLNKMRRRRDPDGIESDDDDDNDTVRRVLGESEDDDDQEMDGIFPTSAEDLDTHNTALQTPLRPIKDVVQEPSHPTGEKEKLLTPYSALTAPDVTPNSMEPIDPSKVPGMEPGAAFKAQDLDIEGTPPSAEASPVVNAMDVLLGRRRGQAQSAAPEEKGEVPGEAAPIMTAEAAERMVNGMGNGVSGEAVLQQGVPMPTPPPPSTGGNIMEAFRRVTKKR